MIRVSGPHSKDVAQKIARTRKEQLVPRKAYLKSLVDPENGEMLDTALFLWFPQPNSFTGEDSLGIKRSFSFKYTFFSTTLNQ